MRYISIIIIALFSAAFAPFVAPVVNFAGGASCPTITYTTATTTTVSSATWAGCTSVAIETYGGGGGGGPIGGGGGGFASQSSISLSGLSGLYVETGTGSSSIGPSAVVKQNNSFGSVLVEATGGDSGFSSGVGGSGIAGSIQRSGGNGAVNGAGGGGAGNLTNGGNGTATGGAGGGGLAGAGGEIDQNGNPCGGGGGFQTGGGFTIGTNSCVRLIFNP